MVPSCIAACDDELPVALVADTDDLSKYYADMAATTTDPNIREAAMKFVVAEAHVKEGEAYEDALRNANKALALFRDIRHRVGVADSLRLIIHAHRMKAKVLSGKHGLEAAIHAEDLATEHAMAFRKLDDKRSEAAMLVSLAEINMGSAVSSKRRKAADAAVEAQAICKADGDKKLEGSAVLALCHMSLEQRKGQEAVKSALEARMHFIAAKDKLGEAKAMHALGLARSCAGELTEAISAAKHAQMLYTSLGLHRQASSEQFAIAKLCLEDGDAQQALSAVDSVFNDIEKARKTGDVWVGWSAAASSLKVQALIAAARLQDAIAAAEERLEAYPKERDVKDHLWALRAMARAQSARGHIDKAVKTLQDALQVAQTTEGHSKWEPSLTFLVAETFGKGGRSAEAATWAQKACERYRRAGDKMGEAKAMYLLGHENLKRKDPIAALKVSRQGRTVASKSEQRIMEAAMLLLATTAHLLMGEEEEGMGASQEAAHIFQEAGDMRSEMECQKLIAAIYKANEEYPEADQAARRGQGLARDLGDKLNEIELLKWQSHCHKQAGNSKQALRAAKDAVRVGKNQDKKTQAESLLLVSQKYLEHLSVEASRQEEPEKLIIAKASLVLKPGAEAVALARAAEEKELTCLGQLIQGQVANQVFRHEEALACSEESLTLALELGDQPCEAAAYIMGAEARYALGRMDLAVELAGKALPIARKINDQGVLERCKRFVNTATGGGGRRGGGKRRRKIGTRIEKRMVEKRVGGGSTALKLSDVKPMAMGVLKELAEEDLTYDDPLMDSGMDSLSSVTFRDKLNKQTGLKLPGTLMFDHPTLGDVAQLIVDQSSEGAGGGEERVEMVEEEVEVSEYEEVSDDDGDYRPRGRRKIGSKKVKKWVQKQVGGGGGDGKTLALPDVKNMSMGVLKELADEELTFDDPLMDSGMDSLSAVTFRDKLNKQTGLKLPGTLMFDHPTLSDVAQLIVDQSAEATGGGDGGPPELQWVEEEVEESEYEDVSDDGDYRPVAPSSQSTAITPAATGSAELAKPQGLDLGDVKNMAMGVLKELGDGNEVTFDDPLMESGLDSLAAVSFRNDLTKKTGIKLPGTLMFDHPTLLGVSEFIVEQSISG